MNHIRKKYIFRYFEGKYLEVEERRIRNALPYIQDRIKYFMPIETIDVEEMLKVIRYVRVRPNRPCSPEEVTALVEQIKAMLTEAVNNMEHHERFLSDKGARNDEARS